MNNTQMRCTAQKPLRDLHAFRVLASLWQGPNYTEQSRRRLRGSSRRHRPPALRESICLVSQIVPYLEGIKKKNGPVSPNVPASGGGNERFRRGGGSGSAVGEGKGIKMALHRYPRIAARFAKILPCTAVILRLIPWDPTLKKK